MWVLLDFLCVILLAVGIWETVQLCHASISSLPGPSYVEAEPQSMQQCGLFLVFQMESSKEDHSDFTFLQNLSGIFHISFYILCLNTVAWVHNMFSQEIRQHLNLHLLICDCLYLPIIQTFLYSVLWLKVKQEICHSMLYSWCLKRSIWNLETHIYREIYAQHFYFLYF